MEGKYLTVSAHRGLEWSISRRETRNEKFRWREISREKKQTRKREIFNPNILRKNHPKTSRKGEKTAIFLNPPPFPSQKPFHSGPDCHFCLNPPFEDTLAFETKHFIKIPKMQIFNFYLIIFFSFFSFSRREIADFFSFLTRNEKPEKLPTLDFRDVG